MADQISSVELLEEMLKQGDLQFFPQFRTRLGRFIDIFNHETTQTKLLYLRNDFVIHLKNIEQCSSVFELMQALRYFIDDANRLRLNSIIRSLQQSGMESIMTDDDLEFLDDDSLTIDQRIEHFFQGGRRNAASSEITDLTTEIASDIRRAFEPLKEKLVTIQTVNKYSIGVLWLGGKAVERIKGDARLCRGAPNWFEDTARYLTNYAKRFYASDDKLKQLLADENFQNDFVNFRTGVEKWSDEMCLMYSFYQAFYNSDIIGKQLEERLLQYHLNALRQMHHRIEVNVKSFNFGIDQHEFIDNRTNFFPYINSIQQSSNVFQLMQAMRCFITDMNRPGLNFVFLPMKSLELENIIIDCSVELLNESTPSQRAEQLAAQYRNQFDYSTNSNFTNEITYDIQQAFQKLRENSSSLFQRIMRTVMDLSDESGLADIVENLIRYLTPNSTLDDEELQHLLQNKQIESKFQCFYECIMELAWKMHIKYRLRCESSMNVSEVLKEAIKQYDLTTATDEKIRKRIDRFMEVFKHNTVQRKLAEYWKNLTHHLNELKDCSSSREIIEALRYFFDDINRFDINSIFLSVQQSEMEYIMIGDAIDWLDNDGLSLDERIEQFLIHGEKQFLKDQTVDLKSEIVSYIQQFFPINEDILETVPIVGTLSKIIPKTFTMLKNAVADNTELCQGCLVLFNDTVKYLTHYITCHDITDNELQKFLIERQLEQHLQIFKECVSSLLDVIGRRYYVSCESSTLMDEKLKKMLQEFNSQDSSLSKKCMDRFIDIFNDETVQNEFKDYQNDFLQHTVKIHQCSNVFQLIQAVRNLIDNVNRVNRNMLFRSVQENNLQAVMIGSGIKILGNDDLNSEQRIAQFISHCKSQSTHDKNMYFESKIKSNITQALKKLKQKLVPESQHSSGTCKQTIEYLVHYMTCRYATDDELNSRLNSEQFKHFLPYLQIYVTESIRKLRIKYCLRKVYGNQLTFMELSANMIQNQSKFSSRFCKRIDRFMDVLNDNIIKQKLVEYWNIILSSLYNIEFDKNVAHIFKALRRFIKDINDISMTPITLLLQPHKFATLILDDMFNFLDTNDLNTDKRVEEFLRLNCVQSASYSSENPIFEIVSDIQHMLDRLERNLHRNTDDGNRSSNRIPFPFRIVHNNTSSDICDMLNNLSRNGRLEVEFSTFQSCIKEWLLKLFIICCLHKAQYNQSTIIEQWKRMIPKDNSELSAKFHAYIDTLMSTFDNIISRFARCENRLLYHLDNIGQAHNSFQFIEQLKQFVYDIDEYEMDLILESTPSSLVKKIISDLETNYSNAEHLNTRQKHDEFMFICGFLPPTNIEQIKPRVLSCVKQLWNVCCEFTMWTQEITNVLNNYVLSNYKADEELSKFLHTERLENDFEHFQTCIKNWTQELRNKLPPNKKFLFEKSAVMNELERMRAFLYAVVLNKRELLDSYNNTDQNRIDNTVEEQVLMNDASLLPCISFGQLPLPTDRRRSVRFTFILNSSSIHQNTGLVLREICSMFQTVQHSEVNLDGNTQKIILDVDIAENIPYLLATIISKLANLNVRSVLIGNFGLEKFRHAMNPAYNRIYSKNEQDTVDGFQLTWFPGSLDRGGEPYYCPVDWRRYAIDVGMTGSEFEREYGEWPVAYHGTRGSLAMAILIHGLRASGHGCYLDNKGGAIYLSPSIEYSGHPRYATVLKVKSKYVQMVLQVRVKKQLYVKKPGTLPGAFPDEKRMDPNFTNKELEWIITKKPGEHAGALDGILVYGIMFRVTDKHPGYLPENRWWGKTRPSWWNFF